MAFFGSVLWDDFVPTSDVDVLMEVEPGVRVGLIRLAGMDNELSDLLGRKVDLNTPGCLSPYFRDQVLREAEVVHEQAWKARKLVARRQRGDLEGDDMLQLASTRAVEVIGEAAGWGCGTA
jgi:predicted nucleotidyltransferase